MTSSFPLFTNEAGEARTWLLEAAAPLWSRAGRTKSGLFAERMTLRGEPEDSYFRTLVQARHIFSFVRIGRMGWGGPWKDLVGETMETVILRARRPDGFYVHRLDIEARPVDRRADLYDQAFVLLALGTAAGALGRDEWFDEAEQLLGIMESAWRHPLGGFFEGEINAAGVRRQNPHMHLLEAFLALHEASGRSRFLHAARSIAELGRGKFVDPCSGALLEYFTDDWNPVAGTEGRLVEPGHCFEWAWLFERFGRMGWKAGLAISDRLSDFARAYGVDQGRNVAINEVLADGSTRDLTARLWPQTERLKAALARFRRLGSDVEAQEAVNAARGVRKYLEVPVAGLWRDKLKQDGTWIDEFAPGSSLYHIACAYDELINTANAAHSERYHV